MSKRFKPVLALVLSLFMSVSTLSNTYTVFAEEETTVQTDEQTNEENSTETTEDSEEETPSEATAAPTEDEKLGDSSMMEYFLVENPVLSSPATENFVLSMNDANGYSDFSITVQKTDGTTFDLEASEQVDKLVKFTKDFSSADKGEYSVTTLHYSYNGEKYYLNFSDIGMDVKFGVDQEYSGYDETLPDMTQDVTEDDELGNAVIQVTSLNDASEEVADGIMASDPEAAMALIDEDSDIAAQSNEGVTICLDPGHGGNDRGAIGVNNVYEKNLTLKIAQYCKQELEKYDCNVVMTRTGDTNEKNWLVSLGWISEGIGWIAPNISDYPVYRLYNANGGEHHYTMKKAEKDMLVKAGWKYEGIGWYSANPDDKSSVPLLREYNPNAFANNHNYTLNKAEHDWLVSLGWKDEGKAWYALD